MNVIIIYALTGLLAGFVGGLLGVGGGILMVPIFFYILKIPMHIAIGSSLGVIVFTSITASVRHFQADNIDIKLVLAVAIFSIFGSYGGAYLCEKLPAPLLRKLFAVLLLATSIKMFFK